MHADSRQSICTLTSGPLEVDVLLHGGPRIVGLRFQNSRNLLASVPEIAVATPNGDFHYIGGHRLWHAPEAMPRSYSPDDTGLITKELDDGILLQGKREPDTGISKSIEVHLQSDHPQVTLVHHLENNGLWDVDLAPWAITMFPLGGVAILPCQAENVDIQGLLPDRNFALWPYASLHDPRLRLEDDFILISAKPNLPSFKVGAFNPRGWLSYWNNGVLFQKRFSVIPNVAYPDNGCNSEIYCDEHFIELESLAPLVRLSPGGTVTYQEDWNLFPGLHQDFLPDNLLGWLRESTNERGGNGS